MYFFTPCPTLRRGHIYLTGLNFWDGPHAGVLDAVVVLAHGDAEEAHFAPVGAPAVAPHPEPLPRGVVTPPAHQTYLRINLNVRVSNLGKCYAMASVDISVQTRVLLMLHAATVIK